MVVFPGTAITIPLPGRDICSGTRSAHRKHYRDSAPHDACGGLRPPWESIVLSAQGALAPCHRQAPQEEQTAALTADRAASERSGRARWGAGRRCSDTVSWCFARSAARHRAVLVTDTELDADRPWDSHGLLDSGAGLWPTCWSSSTSTSSFRT